MEFQSQDSKSNLFMVLKCLENYLMVRIGTIWSTCGSVSSFQTGLHVIR